MASLTRRRPNETIRKPGWSLLAVLTAVAIGGGGCATSGPNHIYLTTGSSSAVHDLGPPPANVSNVLQPGEQAVGLAYDFNTDHLFVRIAPAQVIRVIERPSGKILREMPLPDNLPEDKVVGTNTGPAGAGNGVSSADLAIRSSDRHLFAVHPNGKSVVELTLFGEFVRQMELAGLTGTLRGLAYDQRSNRLLVLSTGTDQPRIGAVASDGHVTYYVTLAGAVSPVSLGYDSAAGHFFVPLADGQTLGEFDANGTLTASHLVPNGTITAIDAGARSLVRVF